MEPHPPRDPSGAGTLSGARLDEAGDDVLVRVRGLVFSHGGRKIFDGVDDWPIEPGERCLRCTPCPAPRPEKP